MPFSCLVAKQMVKRFPPPLDSNLNISAVLESPILFLFMELRVGTEVLDSSEDSLLSCILNVQLLFPG